MAVRSTKRKTIVKGIILLLAGFIAFSGYEVYKMIFRPNVSSHPDDQYLFIHTGSTFEEIVNQLKAKHMLLDEKSFRWLAVKMKYPSKILPGKYFVMPGMNNKELIQLLRSGRQIPVRLTFNNVRTKAELASIVSNDIEADSSSIMKVLDDKIYLKHFGLNADNCISVFIPNTYEFYWNTSATQFFERMSREYKKFWTTSRKAKADSIGLSQSEVATMASIVEQETKLNDEKRMVAGVYMNRLNDGMKLEADPTVIYAVGNFSIRRVLNDHKAFDSPYNTYMYAGLPPGPICIPSISSLDAVLNYTRHDYLFFCAKEDFSGYHCFAKDYKTHQVNARRFQHELDRRNIKS